MKKKLLSLLTCASMAAATLGGTAATAFAAETLVSISRRAGKAGT